MAFQKVFKKSSAFEIFYDLSKGVHKVVWLSKGVQKVFWLVKVSKRVAKWPPVTTAVCILCREIKVYRLSSINYL